MVLRSQPVSLLIPWMLHHRGDEVAKERLRSANGTPSGVPEAGLVQFVASKAGSSNGNACFPFRASQLD